MELLASAPAAPPSSVGLVSHLLSTILLHSDGVAIQRAIEFLPRHRTDALSVSIGDAWREVRSWALAPVLRVAIVVCLVMSVMLLVEVVSMAVVSLAIKILRRRPESRYCWEPINAGDDPESGNLAFPMVLVQIPMYNEREVYKLSIGAACTLSWPSDRIIIQILDDSTDPTVKDRTCSNTMAIWKMLTWHFMDDFAVNFSDCLMTRIQKMTLDYHFKVEQEVGSSTFAFFGFNGTAGVWRISAINEVGGWKDRTTVEDMDLAVRATLGGWKLLYVGDVKVKSELPSTFKAYRRQQHRWTCGAAHLFRKMGIEILKAKEVSIWKKFHLTYSFFFVRKIVAHLVTFFLYCVVIPTSVLVPEVTIPAWGVVYIPSTITILNATRNPSSLHLMPFWILFENVMAMHRMKATIIGLLEAGTFDEWIVTDKLGDTLQDKIRIPLLEQASTSLRDRLNLPELGFAAFLFLCACYNLAYGQNYYYIYIYVQAVAFLVVGCGYVGTFITNP